MGGDEPTQTQETEQKTEPWAAAQPLLMDMIKRYQLQDPSVTGGQTNAMGMIRDSLSNIPNFGGQGIEAVNKILGTNNQPQIGMLNDAFGGLQGRLTATANGENLDPYKTPGFAVAINTMS